MTTKIVPPRVPFIDQRTGLIATEWYRYLLTITTSVDSSGADVNGLYSEPAIQSHVETQALDVSPAEHGLVKEDVVDPPHELGTLAHQNAETFTLPKNSGRGIKVDLSTPTFPWRDLEGLLYPDATAGPVRGTFITGVSAFSYANNKAMDFSFHIPHDWAPGTDLYIHVHWAHNADTSVSGDVVFDFGITYAKGHNQANFSASVAPSITYTLTDISTTPRYRHRIDEIQLTASSPSATQLDVANIEPDGLIQGTITVDLSGATLTTTSPNNSIYIFTIDLHYQSSGIGTKQRAPNFYI